MTEKTLDTILSVLIDDKIEAEKHNKNEINNAHLKSVDAALTELRTLKKEMLNCKPQDNSMDGINIWEVTGINDLEGTCFAQCTTEEKAKKAMQILEQNEFEDMLTLRQSNLGLNQLNVNGKLILL